MEAFESLLREEKIESVSSADITATFKPEQHHWKCIRGVMAVFKEEWLHSSGEKLFMRDFKFNFPH